MHNMGYWRLLAGLLSKNMTWDMFNYRIHCS